MKTKYLVVGVWDDGEYSRFAASKETETPEEAEQAVIKEYTGDGTSCSIIVAGVISVEPNGEMRVEL